MTLHLISHALCPYVQRAAIALAEKGVAFLRTDIDLASKPDWFLAVSPFGKTPVLLVDGAAIFESAVILEYLEETEPNPLHRPAPLDRARDRAWIEFGSAILNDIAGFYAAPDPAVFSARSAALRERFRRVEGELGEGPFFAGTRFGLVDVAFAPVFRYFDVFDAIGDFGILAGLPRVEAWRRALAGRASVRAAVSPDYPVLLRAFLLRRNAHLASLMRAAHAAEAALAIS